MEIRIQNEIAELRDKLPNTKEIILQKTLDFYQIDYKQLTGSSRYPNLVEARQFISFILYSDIYIRMKKINIARFLKKDHSSILNLLKKFEIYYPIYDDFREKFEKYRSFIYQ